MARKMIGMMVAIGCLLLLSSVQVFAAYTPFMCTQAAIKNESTQTITDFQTCKTAVFSAVVKRNAVAAQSAQIYGVLYKNDIVIDTKKIDMTSTEMSKAVSFPIGLPEDRSKLTYKVFIWDTEQGAPLAPVYEFGNDASVVLDPGATVVTNFASLMTAISAKGTTGGTIYIKADRLDCNAQIKLNKSPTNPLKIEAYPGMTPVLDFTNLKEVNDAGVGIRITGNNYYIKGLIIEKAPDNGVQIKSPSTPSPSAPVNAGNSTLEDCVTRYNKDSGIQITNSADHNTLKNCYSYRNFDIYTETGMGANADGFSIKLSRVRDSLDPRQNIGLGNKLINCFSWENSDDGYDSFDWFEDLSYENCMAWQNGDRKVFTGEYDMRKGNAPDENSPLIAYLMQNAQYRENLTKDLSKQAFVIPGDLTMPGISGPIVSAKWSGNPNGFKFGSAAVATNQTHRTVKNLIAFDNGAKGFDQNNAHVSIGLNNAVSFHNGTNYGLELTTITQFQNVIGFQGSSSNSFPSKFVATTPSSAGQVAYEAEVRSMVNYIENSVRANMIPKDIDFSFHSRGLNPPPLGGIRFKP